MGGLIMKNKMGAGIGFKLIRIFLLVIIVPLTVLGTISYFSSRTSLLESSEESKIKYVEATSESINTFVNGYSALVLSLSKDDDAKMIDDSTLISQEALKKFKDVQESYGELLNVYMGTEAGDMYIYPPTELPDGYVAKDRLWYKDAINSQDVVWTEPYVDTGTGTMVISNSMTVEDNGKVKGVFAIDIALTDLKESLKNHKIGDSGELIILSKEGTIISHPNPSLAGYKMRDVNILNAISKDVGDFEYKPFETLNKLSEDASEDEQKAWSSVKEGPSRYAFYKKTDLGWTVIVTIEKSEVIAPANAILLKIAVVALIGIVGAIIFAVLFSRGLTRRIKTILEATQKLKEGDLTGTVEVSSRDEVKQLALNIQEAFDSLSEMLGDIKGISSEVSESATNLAATSQEAAASAEEVGRTVEEISNGAQLQADDTEISAEIAYSLAKKFEELNENTLVMIESTKEAIKANQEGVSKIDLLSKNASESGVANNKIGKSIVELNHQTKEIDVILVSITAIAEQTNLLALNASIEAARAGEHGRGFAVVADEIRKLAEESNKSAEEIRGIVSNIQRDSERTVNEMKVVEGITREQSTAVSQVSQSFKTISSSVEAIAGKIDSISISTGLLKDDKDKLVAAIENISAVSEETAAGAHQVTTSTDQQRIAVAEIARSAEGLNEIALKLNDELSKFIIK